MADIQRCSLIYYDKRSFAVGQPDYIGSGRIGLWAMGVDRPGWGSGEVSSYTEVVKARALIAFDEKRAALVYLAPEA